MYFVNRSEIDARIRYIDKLVEKFKENHPFTTEVEHFALERITHLLIESILDVGNHMIDGFIMRDPGSYHDIIDILIDEKVLPKDDETSYKALIDLRQMIVRDYLQVNHLAIESVLLSNARTYQQFSHHIRRYLDNELGVANAFSNE